MPPIRFEATGVDFEFDTSLNLPLQVVTANFRIETEQVPVRIGFVWRDDGLWEIRRLSWPTAKRLSSLPEGAPQKIADRCADLLRPIYMRSGVETAEGVPLLLNTGRLPQAELERVWFSHRPGILNVASLSWDSLWERIERRIDFDEAFAVQGFDKDDVKRAVAQLASTFPSDWVKARYREAGFHFLNSDFGPGNDGYFPAYHIARTASGALCVDPGWKYLAELGIALDRLQNLSGFERLKGGLASSSGTQHHVCMASDFADRGILRGLEPATGSGSARNDLLVEIHGRNHQVELKEFSSGTPLKRLRKELAVKAQNLPEQPETPVVFHVVLLEQGGLNPAREAEFCASIAGALEDIPKNISAVVVGRRFLDSAGGKIKRDTLQSFLVPDAAKPADGDDLQELFPANYEQLEYPLFGLNAPMHFGNNALELGE